MDLTSRVLRLHIDALMPGPLSPYLARLDSVYRNRPLFIGLKARLLAAFALLVLAFIPVNIAKTLFIHSPALGPRILVNVVVGLAAWFCLRSVYQGHLERAGNRLALAMVLAVHVTVLVVGSMATQLSQPLSVGIQLFAFDLVFIIFALVFASRRIAIATFLLMVAGHLGYSLFMRNRGNLDASDQLSANVLLREGLFAMGFLFCLGITLSRMIEAALRRSEESLRHSQSVNENLERLVSERTRDLEVASRAATAASRAKSEFLANMSHEIRTPLNGIIASADLLIRRQDLSPEAREQSRVIAESGDLLLKLLSDILDFSKIEAGQVVLEKHAFELGSTISDITSLMAHRATASSVQLETSIAPTLASHFEGDSYRLRQVLLNLVANAVKFTPGGGRVIIAIGAGNDAATVRFEVRDSGIGMDEAARNRIFERFTQADSSTTRRYGGTGLGLAISFRLVEMMGGRLEVTSAPGKGSTFFFTIPLRPIVHVPAAAVASELIETDLKLRVLVAEDNAVNRKIIGAQLTQLGCLFTVAVDGEAALAALQREPLPNVILMDCHMPNLDGWETTRQIRRWASSSDALQQKISALPVIALTASAYPEERARCRDVGMNDFIAKPVKLPELQRALLAASTSSLRVEAGVGAA